MDAATLAARSAEARGFTATLGEFTFSCVLPTRLAERVLARAHIRDGEFDALAFGLALVLDTVTGWTGVRACHVVPGAGTEPLPYSREAARLVFAERTDWLEALMRECDARLEARRENWEADLKNWPSASAGN